MEVPASYKQDNEVVYLTNLASLYIERNQSEMSRMQDNFKFYSALNNGQYTQTAVQQHIQERRPLSTFNFIKGKIDTLAGGFLQDPYDTDFESDGNGPNADALLMHTLFTSDKEFGGWEFEKADFILNGLIHTGIMEMGIDYTRDPLGNISLWNSNPFMWRLDPNWTTNKVKDNRRVIKFQWMDVEQIEFGFPKKIDDIREALELFRMQANTNSGDAEIDKVADRSPEFYDSFHHRHKVIQVMEIRREAIKQLWDTEKREFLPLMDKANTTMMKLLMKGRVKEVIHKMEICWVKTICPSLSLNFLLEDAPHPLMINTYPIFVWSATNLNGERQGFVDILKDPQMTYNKRESAYTHAQITATNGALLIESNFFEKGERERFVAEKNIPGSTFLVKDGSIVNGRLGIAQVPREKMPEDMMQSAERAKNSMDVLTPTPPAVTGGEGKSGESAKLFIEKKETALTALVLPNIGIQRIDKQIGEVYFDAAKIRYAGAPREFKNPKTKEVILINMRTMDGVQNDVSKVKRSNVIVTRSKVGHSLKREKVNRYIETAQYVQNPMMKTYMEGKMLEGMPGFTDQDVVEGQKYSQIFLELQVERVESEKAQLRASRVQANAMAGQAATPAAPSEGPSTGPSVPGETPSDGGGFSVEGKKIPALGGVPVDVRTQNQMNG